jgi:hypothetical protein
LPSNTVCIAQRFSIVFCQVELVAYVIGCVRFWRSEPHTIKHRELSHVAITDENNSRGARVLRVHDFRSFNALFGPNWLWIDEKQLFPCDKV